MDKKKSLEQWEKEKGFIVKNESDLSKMLTEAEFDSIELSDRHGVNYEDRIKFLQDNGYPVNRATLIDSNLSARRHPLT